MSYFYKTYMEMVGIALITGSSDAVVQNYAKLALDAWMHTDFRLAFKAQ